LQCAPERNPASFTPALRNDVQAISENLVVSKVQPMTKLIDLARTGPRFSMLLFAAFGIFAGVLAGVGVYGLVSDSVVQRRRQMGIRMALGARQRNILIVTIQNEMSAVALGGIIGFVCSIGLARAYAHTLYGLQATDYLSAAMAFAVLSCVTLASSLVPVLRATKVSVARLLE
jgi:putative ABC transport system permease protein